MLYFYLLFCSLASDFLFQPGKLAEWKSRSVWGILVHVLIHFIFTTFILLLYTWNWKLVFPAMLLSIFHFIIDHIKVALEHKNGKKLRYYWIDQIAHYITILLVTILIWKCPQLNPQLSIENTWGGANSLYQLFLNKWVILFACLSIFITLTVEYGSHSYKGKKKTPPLNVKNMIKRLFLATIVYFGLLFAFLG